MPLYQVMCCQYVTVDAENEQEAIGMVMSNETEDFHFEATELTDEDFPS